MEIIEKPAQIHNIPMRSRFNHWRAIPTIIIIIPITMNRLRVGCVAINARSSYSSLKSITTERKYAFFNKFINTSLNGGVGLF